MAIFDCHSHVLPGIDDGSRDVAMTEAMLTATAEQGIGTIIATPHFYADSMRIGSFVQRRDIALNQVRHIAAHKGITIIPGAEVAFFPGMSRAEEITKLYFQEVRRRIIMIEMPFRPWTERDLNEIELFLRRRDHVIIAHLDRYFALQKDKDIIPALLDMPVIVQINASALSKISGRSRLLKLFKNKQAHLLGSDCHNLDSRPQNLATGRQVIEKKIGTGTLKRIDRLSEKLLIK